MTATTTAPEAPSTRPSGPHGNETSGGHPGGRGPRRKSPADVAQLREHPVPLRRIAALFTPHRTPLAIVIAIIVVSSLIGLATPFLTKHLIDDAIPQQNVHLLLLLVGGMLAVTVVSQALGVIQTWMSTKIGQQVMHGLRTDLFTRPVRMGEQLALF